MNLRCVLVCEGSTQLKVPYMLEGSTQLCQASTQLCQASTQLCQACLFRAVSALHRCRDVFMLCSQSLTYACNEPRLARSPMRTQEVCMCRRSSSGREGGLHPVHIQREMNRIRSSSRRLSFAVVFVKSWSWPGGGYVSVGVRPWCGASARLGGWQT